MKKMLLALLLLCMGCGEKTIKPVEESVSNIDTAKYATARQNTIQFIKSTEIKYMEDIMFDSEKDCYTYDEINMSNVVSSGKVCYEDNEYKAYDVYSNGYVCSGTINQVICEEVK